MEGYYVSVISSNGKDYRLALGPYRTKEQAEKNTDLVRHYVVEAYADGIWYGYGVAKVTSDELHPGVLNEQMSYDGAFWDANGLSKEQF